MSSEKGETKTQPTPEFEWLLAQGTERAVMVSSSWEIPATTEDQPPHVETYRTYKDTSYKLDADLVVTMEHPTKSDPKPVAITLDGAGVTLKREIASSMSIITSTQAPRVG